jgi:hypothetical protein
MPFFGMNDSLILKPKVGKMKKLLLLAGALSMSLSALAADLTINAAEFGIGKFHRQDNKVHKYESNNAWAPFILPENASTKQALIINTSPDTYTIFFTNLEELFTKMVELTAKTGKKVEILNLNAHGLPGGMWFPKDAKTRDSFECASWRAAANNADMDNYNQYYSPVAKSEILSFNQLSNSSRIPSYQCLTGLNEWTAVAAKVPAIKTIFAQVHMLSCIVGMGTLGDAYTTGLAKLLFPKPDSQMVQTSMKFGLGDWSMPEGMGFWGFESDAQLDRDNANYPVNRRDSEEAQKGDIRIAQASLGVVKSGMMRGMDFMLVTHDDRSVTLSAPVANSSKMFIQAPQSIRVPGTNAVLQLK